jgi:MFS family permease
MPSLVLEVPILALLGAAAVTFAATINSTLQLAVAPRMRGRVMALYSVVFLGSTPIGGPIVGALSETFGARAGLLAGSLTSLVTAAVVTAVVLRRRDHGVTPAGATEGAAAAG